MSDRLKVGTYEFTSRLIAGSGKYKNFAITKAATEAAEAEMITVAIRRVNITDPGKENLLDYIDPKKYVILPNTAGCFNAEDAVRTLRLAREAGGWDLVKLEVLGDTETLYPNVVETIKAAETLVAEGFQVMAYTSDDPIVALKLEDVGCVAVMPLGNPIGSGRGLANPFNIRVIKQRASVPIVVDAGIGTASDAAKAMELGADACLINTAIAEAKDECMMARAMRDAVRAGRQAFLAGRMPKRAFASASSPTEGYIWD
ncbi:MAG: thiazole synthase [Zetaproteobacteria bacterium CG_4_9_14_3_um_filter_49_83]|nr:MAG: thiazole synthase [Zetaproteobacteria bacterium CG1_02_49_23]PIQ34703.1 MAG: thiazole synthase [Zetaproteobacteria bacterium CG17_big_fil_post_rev_8_21_14_2_50_50_13]PIY54998.1 MAG: thiazole synthase [Zetaproteobacteria bacterium CG_4_10_14_0_8_um_filter_49_80]PJA34286.1 MAG: thiazole synthase [Zetaproteobacteria bacterium CG_4_9_14_3_um_filter_49_83]